MNMFSKIQPEIIHLKAVFATVALLSLLVITTSFSSSSLISTALAIDQQQPNIDASNLYQTKTMVLGKNIKNLIIEIPNEGHEMPNAKPRELRVVNQPYLPQNAVVNVG